MKFFLAKIRFKVYIVFISIVVIIIIAKIMVLALRSSLIHDEKLDESKKKDILEKIFDENNMSVSNHSDSDPNKFDINFFINEYIKILKYFIELSDNLVLKFILFMFCMFLITMFLYLSFAIVFFIIKKIVKKLFS